MPRCIDNKAENLKKLSAYKKEEIIEALEYAWDSVYITDSMINYLERKKTNDLYAKRDKAMEKDIAASEAYVKWQKEMCVKYGDGQNCKVRDIPEADLRHGAALEKAMSEASKTVKRIYKQIDKLYEKES